MKKLSILLLIVLCQRSVVATIGHDDVATIRQQYLEWQRAYEEKDLARTMEIFAPEVISTFAGGKDNELNAIRQSYEKSFATTESARQWKPLDLEISASDDLAYALADWQMLEDGSVRLTNRSIDVLKRDGTKWKSFARSRFRKTIAR